ncbi:HD domain-containing protein, partial [Myxococcota bacterium]|nr:HD domain-containing protein [Myxococcota bacterium]
ELRRLHPEIAVIMMTGYGQVDTAVECLKYGASDYLTKPVRVNHLAASVIRALDRRRLELENRAYQRGLEGAVEEKTKELEVAYHEISETYRITLEALVTALDARECETGNHSQRVVKLTLAIADRMGITGTEREHLARGALLHDIGKIGVSDQVLLKPGKLTPDEWIEMRRHPEIGARILSGIPFLGPAAEIVLSHQERWDGAGYPRGLAKDEIPIGARIFAVADALDAITSDRPYRRGRPYSYACEEIAKHSGSQFDPDVVRHFLTITEADWNVIRGEMPPFRARAPSRVELPSDVVGGRNR